MISDLIPQSPGVYLLPKSGRMEVPGLIIATPEILEEIDIEQPLQQVRNVACLPGIVGYSIAMPDIHWGYGFPIGGVAGTDADTGVISPGGVGYDINCGVRLATAPMTLNDLTEHVKSELLHTIFKKVPSGVGKEHRKSRKLSEKNYREVVEKGAYWSVEHGYGLEADLSCTESDGVIPGADLSVISEIAKHRGECQLGTIGSGNHFIEIGEIQKIFLPEIAEAWQLKEKQVYLLIHCGSRGFGHQVCQDTLNEFVKKGFAKGLPDKQLVCAPLKSPEGQDYFKALACAANYAFNNRQQILHAVRESYREVCGTPHEQIPLLYDVCHNIAKFEEHVVDGKNMRLCVHRKGATRAFGPGHPDLAECFRGTGQPVLVPGDMGRASYVMVGQGNPLTFASACHGAGRARSRVQSMKHYKGKDLYRIMAEQDVQVLASSTRTVAEEMPDAYKNVDTVVEAAQEAGLARMVARLKPKMVIKG